MRNAFVLSVVALAVLAAAPAWAQLTETQTFDSEAAATAAGWTQVGSHLGFSATDNTGGTSPAGEAGGGLPSNAGGVQVYADMDLGGSLSLADDFSASGEYDVQSITGPNWDYIHGVIGYFDSSHSNGVYGTGVMFIHADDSPTSQRIYPVVMQDGTWLAHGHSPFKIPNDGDYTFDLSWDATAMEGALRIFDSSGVEVQNDAGELGGSIFAVSAEDAAAFPADALNAFGMGSQFPSSGADLVTELYIDNVTYTSLIPEPSTFTLAALGMLSLAVVGWLRRR